MDRETRRLEPGLHLHRARDPWAEATRLATDFDAHLCEDTGQVDALLAEAAALPSLDPAAIEQLAELADRVAAAQRIVDRTLDRAAAEVGARLADRGSGLAIHPSAVRDRAAAVVAGRAALRAAADELEARVAATAHPPPSPAPVPADAVESPRRSSVHARDDEPPARRRRFFGFVGRRRDDPPEDTHESTQLLQQVAASTDQAFGSRQAAAWRDDDTLVLLRVRRDRAQEDVRVAERAWCDLAGDVDVADVDAVVRRFDPQHQDARVVAEDTVGVRTATTLLQRSLDRWADGWRALGLDPPSEVDQGAVRGMAERVVRPVVLVAGAVDRADEVASALPAATVVAVAAAS